MDIVNMSNNMDSVNLEGNEKRTVGQKHGDLRTELLREGLKLLDTEGIEGVTIRAVARNAGVAHSAPANHFPSKREMLTAIGAIVFADLADRTIKAITDFADKPEQAIQAFVETCFQFAFDSPNRYQLLWQRQLIDQDDPAFAEEMERVYSTLLSLFRKAMIHGYISMRLDGNLVAAKDTVTNLPRYKAILLSLIDGIYYRDS